MSKTEFTGHPDARRSKANPLAWINLALLAIIMICCNYIGCREYARVDLSEYESYSISQRTINVLQSEAVQNRETPIRIIFAFQTSSPGYHRMYMLLEEYKRHANGKIEVECFDPLRQPGRAREIENIYKVKFNQELCIVDARDNKNAPIDHYDADPGKANLYSRIPGTAFSRYVVQPDGKRNVVALMMDEVLCSEIIRAAEGQQRKMYVVANKGGIKLDQNGQLEYETISLIRTITGSLNLKLEPIVLSEDAEQDIPADAEGLIIIAPQFDFEPCQIATIRKFWGRNERKSIFIALDSELPYFDTRHVRQETADGSAESTRVVRGPRLSNLYQFLRENGINPNGDDRILLRDSQRFTNNISVFFPESLECTKSFWNNTTQLEGRCRSFSLGHGDDSVASAQRLNFYPLIMTSADYYGETNPSRGAKQDGDDIQGPLCVAAATTRGSVDDPNSLNTLMVVGNLDMLAEEGARKEVRDYLRSIWAWMIEKPEYAGKSTNYDLTVKIDLNRHSRSAVEHLTLIIMPLCALLLALIIWNTRRH